LSGYTLKYIAKNTHIPAPQVYGTQMLPMRVAGGAFMQKIRGVSAFDRWDELSFDAMKAMISEVGKHVAELFSLRFESIGSLYLTSNPSGEESFYLGPIFHRTFPVLVRDLFASQRLDRLRTSNYLNFVAHF